MISKRVAESFSCSTKFFDAFIWEGPDRLNRFVLMRRSHEPDPAGTSTFGLKETKHHAAWMRAAILSVSGRGEPFAQKRRSQNFVQLRGSIIDAVLQFAHLLCILICGPAPQKNCATDQCFTHLSFFSQNLFPSDFAFSLKYCEPHDRRTKHDGPCSCPPCLMTHEFFPPWTGLARRTCIQIHTVYQQRRY